MHRKQKLDEKQKLEIIAIISVGCTRYTAARYVGCRLEDIRREIGRSHDFAQQVAQAEEAAEVYYMRQIKNAAKKEQYWRAAAWVLERRSPNRYASRGAQTVTLEQLSALMTHIGEIVGGEIKDVETRVNIMNRLRRLTDALMATNSLTERPERRCESDEGTNDNEET